MSITAILDVSRQALYIMLLISAPMLIVGLVVGLIISIIQAVTQIHEMTLTFIPKIVAIVFALILFMPWMLNLLVDYVVNLFLMIPQAVG